MKKILSLRTSRRLSIIPHFEQSNSSTNNNPITSTHALKTYNRQGQPFLIDRADDTFPILIVPEFYNPNSHEGEPVYIHNEVCVKDALTRTQNLLQLNGWLYDNGHIVKWEKDERDEKRAAFFAFAKSILDPIAAEISDLTTNKYSEDKFVRALELTAIWQGTSRVLTQVLLYHMATEIESEVGSYYKEHSGHNFHWTLYIFNRLADNAAGAGKQTDIDFNIRYRLHDDSIFLESQITGRIKDIVTIYTTGMTELCGNHIPLESAPDFVVKPISEATGKPFKGHEKEVQFLATVKESAIVIRGAHFFAGYLSGFPELSEPETSRTLSLEQNLGHKTSKTSVARIGHRAYVLDKTDLKFLILRMADELTNTKDPHGLPAEVLEHIFSVVPVTLALINAIQDLTKEETTLLSAKMIEDYFFSPNPTIIKSCLTMFFKLGVIDPTLIIDGQHIHEQSDLRFFSGRTVDDVLNDKTISTHDKALVIQWALFKWSITLLTYFENYKITAQNILNLPPEAPFNLELTPTPKHLLSPSSTLSSPSPSLSNLRDTGHRNSEPQEDSDFAPFSESNTNTVSSPVLKSSQLKSLRKINSEDPK